MKWITRGTRLLGGYLKLGIPSLPSLMPGMDSNSHDGLIAWMILGWYLNCGAKGSALQRCRLKFPTTPAYNTWLLTHYLWVIGSQAFVAGSLCVTPCVPGQRSAPVCCMSLFGLHRTRSSSPLPSMLLQISTVAVEAAAAALRKRCSPCLQISLQEWIITTGRRQKCKIKVDGNDMTLACSRAKGLSRRLPHVEMQRRWRPRV